MTSLQSTLGEEPGIAEELAESQREISIAEFFEKNKHMLGFDSGARGLVTAVKEAVDNSLDACEEANILPDIYVEISEERNYYKLIIEDNGPGITKEEVPKVFGKLLYGSRFHVREQSRGQQGIGISAAVLYSQLTSGKPAKVTSRPKGSSDAEYFELIIDTDTNEPEIKHSETTTWDRPHGTRIELEMEANMRARSQLHDYIKHTAVVNPHARIELREPGLDEPLKFERATDELPAETSEIKPHPHGVELGTLIKMLEATDSYSISGFLQEEFTRVGGKTTDKIVDRFRDRYFGREIAWAGPKLDPEEGIESALIEAVSNKGAEATEAFASEVASIVAGRERLARFELREIVDTVADDIEDETGKTFGSTVRENAVEAAWSAIAAYDRESEDDREIEGDRERDDEAGGAATTEDALTPDLYALVDEATSDRKDDATIQGLAERLAGRLAEGTDDRFRISHDNLERLVHEAADATVEYDDATIGETAREKVTAAIWGRSRTVPDELPRVKAVAGDRDAASDLLEAMRETDILSPPTGCLSPITEELVEAGLKKEFDADFYAASTRDAEVHGGDPFVVEAGIAYGGELAAEGSIDLLRFANRVPLVYQRGACATTDVVKSIGWRNYGLDQPGGSGMPNGPAVVMVHVASTNVPFTSESKDAIANVPEIEHEIELAIREAARELKSYLNARRSRQKRRQKQEVLGRILPEMADKVAEVTGRERPNIDGAMGRIMNNLLIDRTVDGDRVRLVVNNHTGRSEAPEITEIVSIEPELSDGDATVVDLDDEWFIQWSPSISSGESATLEYGIDGRYGDDGGDDGRDGLPEISFGLTVDGVDEEKVTVTAGEDR